jgi:DNA-binding IclR family transcriptional regulator
MPSPENEEPASAGGANVKSAERVLSVFEYFEDKRQPRTLSEISHDLGYPASSTLALLRSMQALGYLIYSFEDKTYFPSIRLAMLGGWLQEQLFRDGTISQMMDHLSSVTQETVLLGIQNGLQSQYIHVVQAPQLLRYHPPVGTLRPLLRSSIGRVLLSRQPRAVVVKVIKRINDSGVDSGRKYKVDDVLADLDKVRRDGFAFTANQITQGAAVLAYALPTRAGEQPMAIGLGGPALRLEAAIPQLVPMITRAVADFLSTPEETVLTED